MRALILALLLFAGMAKAQIVNIPDPNFKAELIAQGVDIDDDGEIQETEAFVFTSIGLINQPLITSIEGIQSFVNASSINLQNVPQLTGADFSGMAHLHNVWLSDLPAFISLDLTGCNQLQVLNVSKVPNLPSIDVSGHTTLYNLFINGLAYLGPTMNLTSLNLTGCSGLQQITLGATTLANLDVSTCTELQQFTYEDNSVPNLDFSGLTNLQTVRLGSNTSSNSLLSVNVNGCTSLVDLYVQDNFQLAAIYMKNGVDETLHLTFCPVLAFICADDSQISAIQTILNTQSMTSTVCNSYCSFTPGGDYNTISGSVTFDADNNGCDAGDPIRPNIKVDLGSTGATFTNNAGNYTFYTLAGNFVWSPSIENPTWFNFSPTQGSVNFADNNNNTTSQNFCITANGIHPDLEVVLEPIGPARPGFSAAYRIVYKNKGNQTLSGNVALTFEDAKLDFVSAFPIVNSQSINNLIWNYSNLQPFESRAISIVFHVNSPADTPAVNIGDILHFSTLINPVAGDEFPSDNTFNYNQTVVGSYDPNEITCLEGDLVPPSEIGNYLHYAVMFENTGNYQAENVVVKVVVDTNQYDMNSLQLLNTSHPSYTRVTGNVAEFIFEGINLAAVSGNPPVGGHGDILFKIRSKNTLTEGDHVNKSGKIYFDYNMPITTNTAETTFQSLSNGIHHLDNTISIYPNPTHSIININSNSNIKTIELYDIQGRVLETDLVNSDNVVFDISEKQNGIYFLKITSENGSKVEKIVKE